jgi:hypothetical protein
MEPFLITKVEEIIRISGRGFVIVPAFAREGPPNPVHVGDQIELRRQDGTTMRSKLFGISHLRGLNGRSSWGLQLPPEVEETNTPVGTEVWWIAERTK